MTGHILEVSVQPLKMTLTYEKEVGFYIIKTFYIFWTIFKEIQAYYSYFDPYF